MPSVNTPSLTAQQDEWLWGWDPTPGIVSVWAEPSGQVFLWRRDPHSGVLIHETSRMRPWILLESLNDLQHLGAQLQRDGHPSAQFTYRELHGPGALRVVVSAPTTAMLTNAILRGATTRRGEPVKHLRDLPPSSYHMLPPEEQYLVATGRTYFHGLGFHQLRRLQFDLETTGLDPASNRVFLIAVRNPDGDVQLLEAEDESPRAEAALITEFVALVRAHDPDVLENHNLHGFDLPFLERRARVLRIPLSLGRLHHRSLAQRAAQRGARSSTDATRRVRFIAPGRECIDTLDAVRRYDFSARELPSHGLKAVAKHLGISGPDRELIRGDQIYETYRVDPARVRRYAASDVQEVAALAEMMGGAAFALARMAPRRYERLADAGAATGVIDPLLVRAYLRAGEALPAYAQGDGTVHSGAALHLFATGVAQHIVKADVASLYPSLMRAYRIGPTRDHLGALLALVDRLVEHRLAAKASAKQAPAGSAERHTHEATSAAMKLVVNSAYGYLAAGEGLTRFNDVHAANEVTRRGRETLLLMCRALASHGVTLLEADTDGVYFAVPQSWTEAQERQVVADVAALLPSLVQLEFEGRYAAMLSHEPKNYALLGYDGSLTLRGVAFRSSRAEPFGERFLRRAISHVLCDDLPGVREVYLDTLRALRQRALPTVDVAARVRLTKSPARYHAVRAARREFSYEAMLASGRTAWSVGDRVRVYRTQSGSGAVVDEFEGESLLTDANDRRDYDVEYYARVLHRNFASRLARTMRPEAFAVVFADAHQLPLFAPALSSLHTVLEAHDTLPSS